MQQLVHGFPAAKMPWALSKVLGPKRRIPPRPCSPAGCPVLGCPLEKTVGRRPVWKWCTRGWGHRIPRNNVYGVSKSTEEGSICRGDEKGGLWWEN